MMRRDDIVKRFEKAIMQMADRIEKNSAFGAIRQGLILLIPLLVAGYGALLLISLPIPVYQDFITGLWDGRALAVLYFIHKGVNDFFAPILAVTTSISYAMIKQKRHGMQFGMGDLIIQAVVTLAALASYAGIPHGEFEVSAFSTKNTFTALVVALVSGQLFFLIKKLRFEYFKRRRIDTDNLYMEAVDGIVATTFVLLFFALFHQMLCIFFRVNGLQELFEKGINYALQTIPNGLGAGALVVFVTHFLWFFGIHGHNVLDVVIRQNFSDVTAGIFSKTMQDVFVIMGGTGAMLCLVIAILLFSKKKTIRNIAVMASPTVLFNISEIVLFGIPVILNPIFFVPFMLIPLLNYLIAYAAISVGLVPHIVQEVEWTTPVLLSGYHATGSWKGAALQLVCIFVGVMVYRPFIRLFEKHGEKRLKENVQKLVGEMQREESAKTITRLTSRTDNLGSVARLLAADLEEAIRKKELFLMYQPQISTDGTCIGAEALIRWQHPAIGFVYPPLIIQLAKEKKVLHILEEFIFDEAAKAIAKLEEEVSGEFKISVNITNESLEWDGFEHCVDSCVKKYHVPTDKLWLEITEQDALSSTMEVVDKLKSLKEKGHKFLIDDFGMGHTSLIYLQTNYFDVVKLDKALTKDVTENKRNSNIIESIVNLGRSLSFTTIAEFVETDEQRDELKNLGCDAFQGYLYSKPVLLDELIRWLKEHYEKEE